jgi:type IV secretory pathway TraG/TraD family ATPase VirD4
MKGEEWRSVILLPIIFLFLILNELWTHVPVGQRYLLVAFLLSILALTTLYYFNNHSRWGRQRTKRLERLASIPRELLFGADGVLMGEDVDLGEKIILPDGIRKRHVHVVGATGSGKTESVILNFLRQDTARGLGSIILDAKGDTSFLTDLQRHVPAERLQVFDLGDEESVAYNPLAAGTPLEAAQRLFASMTWSEEYYRSKHCPRFNDFFKRITNRGNVIPPLGNLQVI